MADFFTFLGTFIGSFVKPIFAFLSDNRISVYLGTSLLTVAVGFFIIRWLYNVFISHPDHVGASGFASALRSVDRSGTNRISKTDSTYSSAYRHIQ